MIRLSCPANNPFPLLLLHAAEAESCLPTLEAATCLCVCTHTHERTCASASNWVADAAMRMRTERERVSRVFYPPSFSHLPGGAKIFLTPQQNYSMYGVITAHHALLELNSHSSVQIVVTPRVCAGTLIKQRLQQQRRRQWRQKTRCCIGLPLLSSPDSRDNNSAKPNSSTGKTSL